MTIFLIADSHFDALDHMKHVFPRPEFKDNEDMNQKMIKNWNSIVKPSDVVISVGDFCYTDPRPWLHQLNGYIILIRGNHDNWCGGYEGEHHTILHYLGMEFYIVHNPADAPEGWPGWIIHGHHHWRKEFPHINGPKKNINVAAELVNYTPVSLGDILETENLEKMVMMTRA